MPVRSWLADERYNRPVAEKLFGDTAKLFFREEALRDLWDRFTSGEDTLWNRVYAIYAFLLWYDAKF